MPGTMLSEFGKTSKCPTGHYQVGKQNLARNHCNFAYSALASFKMGMSRSVFLQSVRKSLYAAFALAVSPAIA